MLNVKPLTRAEIDAWTVAESGLPVRVVNSTASAGIQTIGDLRLRSDASLLDLRGLGRISLKQVHAFLRIADQIERGRQQFESIPEVLRIFLDDEETRVVMGRYGLPCERPDVFGEVRTLQEIGDAEHKTRERIRQIQESALHKLRSRLGDCCFEPFCDRFVARINLHGRVMSCAELAGAELAPITGGLNVAGVALLLSELAPRRITVCGHFFSTLPADVIGGIERKAAQALSRRPDPSTAAEVAEDLADTAGVSDPAVLQRVVEIVLEHNPSIAGTADGRFFPFEEGAHRFLLEVLRGQPRRPAHYRGLTDRFNELLKPRSRKGAGFVLEILNSSPKCTRVDRGVYDLKAE